MVLSVSLLSGCQGMGGGDAVYASDYLLDLKRQAAKAYAEDRFADALPIYQELNAAIPGDALLWLRTGNTHARLNQPEDAVRSYREALKIDSGLSKAWHNMGIIQLRQAANSFTRMVEYIDPGDPLYPRAVDLSESTLEILNGRQDDGKQVE